MTLRVYLHSRSKRAETIALLDSGATENFMSLDYAKYLHLPIKTLKEPRRLFNVDGTPNRTGDLKYYTDLTTRTGQSTRTLRYFLSDLGDNKVILGYPWFVAAQPKIDWARGWIAHDQLPIVLRAADVIKARFVPRQDIARRAIVTKSDPKIPPQYKNFLDVFTPRKGAGMPPSRPWDHEIELKPGAPATLRSKLIRLSQAEQVELSTFLKDHLKRGTIRPSKSPYAASFFFIKKKNGKLRPVQDYRPVNAWTVKNRYPLPLIPQLTDRLRGCTKFTALDILWGYNEIPIKEKDRWKAAFITNEGLYEPNVMFFGLTNSPATFQTMMNTIFRELIDEGNVTIYMDDIAIHTAPREGESEEQHTQRHRELVRRVLLRLRENDLHLNPEKCTFEQSHINFLGVRVSNGEIRMDQEKVERVKEWP
jgi:Reverse transcriptase (RNA-dependent DNA polymerase)